MRAWPPATTPLDRAFCKAIAAMARYAEGWFLHIELDVAKATEFGVEADFAEARLAAVRQGADE